MQISGMVLSMDNIKLSIFEGIIVKHVRCHRKKVVGLPLFEAEKVVLHLAPARWLKGESALKGARIINGTVRLLFNSLDNKDAPDSNMVVIEKVSAVVEFDFPRLIRVVDFSAELLGAQIRGRGDLILNGEPAPERAASDQAAVKTAKLGNGIGEAEMNMYVKELLRCSKGILESNAVHADVDFSIDPVNIRQMAVQLKVVGRNISVERLPAGVWVAKIGLKGKTGKATVNIKNCSIQRVWTEKAFFLFHFDEEMLRLKNLDAVIGQDSWRGPLKGSMNYHFGTRRYDGRISCGFAPQAFLALLRAHDLPHASYVESFEFDQDMPALTADFKGTVDDHPCFQLAGAVEASDFSYNGVSNVLMNSALLIDISETNETVTLSPCCVVRKEGSVKGGVNINLESEMVDFEALSSADPKAVAKMIGPFMEELIEDFRFEGPVKIMASGTVGYEDDENDDIDVAIEGNQVGWKMLLADQCSMSLRVLSDDVELTDIQCSVYGGNVEGSVLLYPVLDITNTRYEIQAKGDNVDFGLLMHAVAKNGGGGYYGKVSAKCDLEGYAGDGAGKTASGQGQINISDGRLFQIPLLGDLSGILTSIIPGASVLLCRTDAKASVVIRDGKIHSDEILIEGDIFSLNAKGDCYFDERLDFNVQFKLLRKHSLAGGVVQIVTLPVTKMLEFFLSGTLDSPRWRPIRLPKEMFLIFR